LVEGDENVSAYFWGFLIAESLKTSLIADFAVLLFKKWGNL